MVLWVDRRITIGFRWLNNACVTTYYLLKCCHWQEQQNWIQKIHSWQFMCRSVHLTTHKSLPITNYITIHFTRGQPRGPPGCCSCSVSASHPLGYIRSLWLSCRSWSVLSKGTPFVLSTSVRVCVRCGEKVWFAFKVEGICCERPSSRSWLSGKSISCEIFLLRRVAPLMRMGACQHPLACL